MVSFLRPNQAELIHGKMRIYVETQTTVIWSIHTAKEERKNQWEEQTRSIWVWERDAEGTRGRWERTKCQTADFVNNGLESSGSTIRQFHHPDMKNNFISRLTIMVYGVVFSLFWAPQRCPLSVQQSCRPRRYDKRQTCIQHTVKYLNVIFYTSYRVASRKRCINVNAFAVTNFI
jgi:hypothetical protein